MMQCSGVMRSRAVTIAGQMRRLAPQQLQRTPRSAPTNGQTTISTNSRTALSRDLWSSTCAPGARGGAALSQQRRQYHEAVIDHFEKPRNVGKLDAKKSSVGSALVGKASCGDVIRLQIEVEKDAATGEERIKDAKFKTFGCGSAIASSSLATEMVIGKSVNDASKLKNTDISEHLSLPPVKIHCSVLAEEAIQAAIEDYRKKQE